MQDIPPDTDDNLPTAQPSSVDVPPIASPAPAAEDASDEEDAKLLQAAFKTAGIRGLLPSALAKEERIARLNETRSRRRSGEALTVTEVREDLSKILTHLTTQLSTHTAGVSIILKMPAQALLYAERTANYAISDYPRSFDNDMVLTGLWDALERIYFTAADWRRDPNKGDGRAVIVAIDRIAKAAIRAVYTASDQASTDGSDSSSETDLSDPL